MDTFAPRLRERWPAATLISLFLFVTGAVVFLQIGPAKVETGEVVRFGIRATHVGNKPTVIVRTPVGEQHEIIASSGALRGCASGDEIQLVRKARRLEVAPFGCP
jgi:hypothetical protein